MLDLWAGTRCVESHFFVMGTVHSKGRNRMVNTRVRKLTAVVTNTNMLDLASQPGFGAEEKAKAVESDSDQDESDDGYVSDTDDEMDVAKLTAAEA